MTVLKALPEFWAWFYSAWLYSRVKTRWIDNRVTVFSFFFTQYFWRDLWSIWFLQEEKYVSCDIVEENKTTTGLDCSVGNLYLPALAKVNESPFSSQREKKKVIRFLRAKWICEIESKLSSRAAQHQLSAGREPEQSRQSDCQHPHGKVRMDASQTEAEVWNRSRTVCQSQLRFCYRAFWNTLEHQSHDSRSSHKETSLCCYT